ncbi:MAG: hypothetical protein BWY83_01240 [bacterium ADurb.Bin478]|nr:MAG: hypothetical protein BWY83_01240 [bacterium ADurb.Bin478]
MIKQITEVKLKIILIDIAKRMIIMLQSNDFTIIIHTNKQYTSMSVCECSYAFYDYILKHFVDRPEFQIPP